jgi:hypothetical protein
VAKIASFFAPATAIGTSLDRVSDGVLTEGKTFAKPAVTFGAGASISLWQEHETCSYFAQQQHPGNSESSRMPAQTELEFLGVLVRSNTKHAASYATGLLDEYIKRICPNGSAEQQAAARADFIVKIEQSVGHLDRGTKVIAKLQKAAG